MRTKAMLVLLVLLAQTLYGCSGSRAVSPRPGLPNTGSGESSAGAPAGGPTSAAVAPPGLYNQPDGTVQALGILTYRDSEGGFWAVVNTAVAENAGSAAVIAVIKPDNDIAESMESFRGDYVSIIGTRDDDRTYKAGPLIEGRTIEVVSDTVVN